MGYNIPKGVYKKYSETFPFLIQYFIDNNVQIPVWLKKAKDNGSPWINKEIFEKARQDKEFIELQYLLLNTKALQTQFFIDRLYQSMIEIIKHVPREQREHIIKNYNTLAKTKGGWYALVDYVNFKGKGIKDNEQYNNQGWGLLQVLEEMNNVKIGSSALNEFSRSAKKILKLRASHSPNNREQKWLQGWFYRIDTYVNIEN